MRKEGLGTGSTHGQYINFLGLLLSVQICWNFPGNIRILQKLTLYGGLKRKRERKKSGKEMVEFSLSESITRFQTAEKYGFPPVENPSSELNSVIDRLAISPEQIDESQETLESLIDLSQGFLHLSFKLQGQLSYLVGSSLKNLARDINSNLNETSNHSELLSIIPQWRRYLEEYGFIVHVLMDFLQENIHKAGSQSSKFVRGRKGAALTAATGVDPSTVELFKRSCDQMESLCEAVLSVLEINLIKIFQTTPETDFYVSIFTRPLYFLTEVEPSIKVPRLKSLVISVISASVKKHGQALSAQNALMTNLTYFAHLPSFIAELLTVLSNDYDYPRLLEDILKEISNRVFNPKDATGPKSIAAFLVKLSELSPLNMLKQMSSLIKLLNNSSITLRCAIVEACGNIIAELSEDTQVFSHWKQQILVLIELLEERFQDSNPYVRTKAIQGCLKIVELTSQFHQKRAKLTFLAVRSLNDKSSLVRRNSIKLLSQILLKHPFSGIHGTSLRLNDWKNYLDVAETVLKKYSSVEGHSMDDHDNEGEVVEEELGTNRVQLSPREAGLRTDTDPQIAIDGDKQSKAQLLVAYYKDAITFIETIHEGISLISNLLFSKNRNEVLEAMDFLVLCDAFDLEPSKSAIKRMLYLIWVKGTTDEGTSISSHLIECYAQLFLTVPDGTSPNETNVYIAKNLIQLTVGISVSDQTSLERLLCEMYKSGKIGDGVVETLWKIYSSVSRDSRSPTRLSDEQVRGAIIILGMLASVNNDIVLQGFNSLLTIGLGKIGQRDLVLCKYSCVVLSRITAKGQDSSGPIVSKDQEEEAVRRLYQIIVGYTNDPEYYPMCEQAINALFVLSSAPDVIVSELIKEKTMMTFGKLEHAEEQTDDGSRSRVTYLSQLLFIVGHVSLKLLVYLERCESEFKRRKLPAGTTEGDRNYGNNNNNNGDDPGNHDELEMIGGTNEDDFTEAIQFIKESELLNGPTSLIGKFSPITEEILTNSERFNDPILQRSATLCMEKLMCVSSKYCEKKLPLLITIMEKSPDPIIRSNAILGLGDMAVSFNNLIDENADYLYRRLHDNDLTVQHTCLMTVTFLILAGQIKVKGQLAEMAKCLEHPDQKIRDMSRLFFTELSTKDNSIYNGFIDIFSNLSADSSLPREEFKRIIKYLLSFIEKEKHQKQLSEKLLRRLLKCSDQKQWDDVAFVLASIPYKNEEVSGLLERGFKMVATKN